MSESGRLIRNTGIIALGGMATKLVQFLLLPLYTSELNTAEFGTIDYLNTIALFCVPVVSMLMDEALFRFLIDCKDDSERVRVATNSCAILFAGCLVLLLLTIVVRIVFAPVNLMWVVSLVLASTILQMTAALLRGFGKTADYALLSFSASALTIVLNVVLIAFAGMGVTGMLMATVIGQALVSIFFLIKERVWKYINVHMLEVENVKELVVYSLPLIPNKVSWTIMNMLDRLIIMNTIGADPAGIYAVAYKFPNVMDTLYGFFYQAWKESTARALGSNENQFAFYNTVYRMLKRFMMSVVLGMIALMPIAYGLLVNSAYSEGLRYVPILLIATFFSNMSGFYGGIFTAYKDTKIMGTTTVVSAAICALLCFVLIPRFGLYGASVSTLIAIFAVNEYRRIKISTYVILDESLQEITATVIVLSIELSLYYLALHFNNPFLLVPCILLSSAFAVIANLDLIRILIAKVHTKTRGD